MSLSSSTVGGKIKYKIVLLGNQHVGKTSIIDRFINDRFESNYCATIGIDFLVRNLTYQNKQYRLQLWDTAGQERFKSLIPSYLKDSHICILVFDVGDSKSLQSLQKWQELYNQHKQYSAFSVVVGNKNDLPSKQCTSQLIQETLKKLKDPPLFQISAKTGEGVSDLFYNIIDLISNKLNSIKIIDQIDEKEEKLQRDEKQKPDHSDRPKQPYESASTLSAIKLQQVYDAPEQKRRCC